MPAGMEGMTFYDSFDSKIYAADNTVFFDCLVGIQGTGRSKTAIAPQVRGDGLSIKSNEKQKNLFNHMFYSVLPVVSLNPAVDTF